MKSRIMFMLSAVLSILVMVTAVFAQDTLKDKEDKVSYVLGLNVGYDLKQQLIEVRPDIFLRGVKDILSEEKRLLSDEEIRETMALFEKELAEKQANAINKVAQKNKQDGTAFF